MHLEASFEPLRLRLRHIFGTSHSSSSTRTNALYIFTLHKGGSNGTSIVSGEGECGLPPKKPGCYLADVTDCEECFDSYCTLLEESLQTPLPREPNLRPLTNLGSNVFGHLAQSLTQPSESPPTRRQVAAVCLVLLDHCDKLDTPDTKHYRAGRSGLEIAILSLWSKFNEQTLRELAGISLVHATSPTRSFYTAALNDNIQEMEASCRAGLEYTPCIKIKLDADVQKSTTILLHFAEQRLGSVWSLDANAAWDIDGAERHIPLLRRVVSELGQCVYMVEQPFPLSYVPGEDRALDERWQAFRKDLHTIQNPEGSRHHGGGILLYADESISNEDDIQRFAHVVDGVNIKLEKAGGIRSAVRAVHAARSLGLGVWIGTMVSTCLGCTAAANVAYLADDSDVDGGLLVYPDVFEGGFTWRAEDGAILLPGINGEAVGSSECWGLGVKRVGQV